MSSINNGGGYIMALDLNDMSGVVIVLVTTGIVLGIGLTVLESFVGATSGSVATSVNDTANAIGDFGTSWLPIIVTVTASVIVLGLVLRAFR